MRVCFEVCGVGELLGAVGAAVAEAAAAAQGRRVGVRQDGGYVLLVVVDLGSLRELDGGRGPRHDV